MENLLPVELDSAAAGLAGIAVRPLREVEKEHILKVLLYFLNNKTKAALALGISQKTLFNKLKEYRQVAEEAASNSSSQAA